MKPSPNQNADRRSLKGEPMGTRRRKYMQPSRDHSKGGQNKIALEAKRAIALAFECLGGVDAMVAWAGKNSTNMSAFYKQMFVKLIPFQIADPPDAVREEDVAQVLLKLERAINDIVERRVAQPKAAAGLRDGTAESEPVPRPERQGQNRNKRTSLAALAPITPFGQLRLAAICPSLPQLRK
jgi:hypothetical protein